MLDKAWALGAAAPARPPWPSEGSPTFSIGFADCVFASMPAAFLIVLNLAVASLATRDPHGKRRKSVLMPLISILALDLISIIFYAQLPTDSPLRSQYGSLTYALRALASLTLVLSYLRLPTHSLRIVGFYLLLKSLFDAVRIHALWCLAVDMASGSAETRLSIIQSVIVGVSVVFLLYEAIASRRPVLKGSLVEVNEQDSSTLDRLFFGWVWPLLSLGRTTKLVEADIKHIAYHPYAVHREERAIAPPHAARKFYSTALLQYMFALALSIVSAAAKLIQPFLIGAIVRFMQSKGALEMGIWLVIAMFVNQWTVAICNAHSEHLNSQVDYRLRSYLVQKVFQRALSPNAQVGSTESTSSKAMVHASVDIPTVVQGPQVMRNFLADILVVAVASYMLYRQIGVAFMGPLILAIIGTLVPVLLGPKVAKAARASREATELRLQAMKQVTADVRNVRMGGLQELTAAQVADFRNLEVKRETNLRRLLVVVVVIALGLESLCVLAAFTIFSLNPSATLDYSKLFTSLTILTVMISPLLSTLQQVPAMISGIVSWKRVNAFVSSKPDPAFFANRHTNLGQGNDATQDYRDDADVSYLLKFDKACLGWSSDSNILRDITMTLESGDIVVVTGRSASGKSTLLKCVLGEGQVHKGLVDLQATDIAFCDQTPWFVPNISLRDNIVLNKSFDQSLYASVLKCCCLGEDFAGQENGDQTTIDSKGTALSGGQRARLSLARALYQEAELLMLDDVFSGLDRTTLNEVADNIFGPGGYLSSRPHVSVLFSSTIVPPVILHHSRAKVLLLENGESTVVETQQLSSALVLDQASVDQADVEPIKESDDTSQSTPLASSEEDETPDKAAGESVAYLRSLGSWSTVLFVAASTGAFAALYQLSMFWLTVWSDAYAGGGAVNAAFYVGVYSLFTASIWIMLFVVVAILFLKMIPSSGLAIHKDMLATFLQSPASVIEATKSQILNRFTQDIQIIDNALPFALINLQLATVLIISSIIVVGIGAPYSLLLVVVAIPPLWLLQRHYLATSTRLRVLQMGAQAPILGALGASLDGRLTLRAFKLNDRMMVDMTARVHKGLRPGYLFTSLQTWLNLTLDAGNILLITLVSTMLVTLKQQAGVGWGALALVNALNLANYIKGIMQSWTHWEMSMGSMTRILSYTKNTPVEYAKGSQVEVSAEWPTHGDVSLKKLTLAYTDKEIVRDVSLHIPAGTKIAILGRTGSGKTSLMQSFFGLLRTVRGSIEVDGVQLGSIKPSLLRSKLVGNPQQTFSNGIATLRRNIDPLQKCSDDEIRTAIERVTPNIAFHEEIMSKLDCKWEECTFSAGWQRQIGLARMMLRKSSVYILDEPTSGMDDADHDAIMSCLFESLTDKTVVIITHTVNGIEKFDHVAVMADGELVESAPPGELLQDKSSRLYKYVHASS